MNVSMLTFARRDGALVHIREVASGRQRDCFCPACSQSLVAKKGSQLGHHFAHDSGSSCNLESAFHLIAKELLYERITRALASKTELALSWSCEECNESHSGNLLKRAASVHLEQAVGEARPDLVLRAAGGQPVAALEIVVTHAPEKTALSFYRRSRIAVVQIRVDTEHDLEWLHAGNPLHAKRCSVCKNPKCDECGFQKNTRWVHVEWRACHACGRPMCVAEAEVAGISSSPEQFTETDAVLAQQHGCTLKVCKSNKSGRSYLANVCEHCGKFVGSHHVLNTTVPRKRVWSGASGHYCMRCGR